MPVMKKTESVDNITTMPKPRKPRLTKAQLYRKQLAEWNKAVNDLVENNKHIA